MSGNFAPRFDTESELVGKSVRVQLEDGSIDDGWTVDFLIGSTAVVVKEINPAIRLVQQRNVPIDELLSWQ